MKDWEGRDVVGPEDPGAIIRVWEIDPYPGDGYDIAVVRGYQEARNVAQMALEHLMEQYDSGECPRRTLSIRVVEMPLDEYEDASATSEAD